MILPSPTERAERALRDLGVESLTVARRLLPLWAGYAELSERDIRHVLAGFTSVESDDFDEYVDAVPLPGRLFGGAR